MALSPGARLGAYEVIAPIGAGGMGEVYRARDTRLDRDVAIKALPDPVASDPERVARFEREARLLAALNHPHIGAIYGVEEVSRSRFLILEFVEGQSLASRLKAGPLGMDEAVAIAFQLLDALESAHDKGIIHRDLKPANIMLTADGLVKVLDFGLARVVEPEAASDSTNSPTMSLAGTQAGVILGTAGYMSPEQAKGRVADKRSDVWAFGCVLYEMLAGRRVFDGEDVSDTLAAVLRAEPDWSRLPGDLPTGVRTLLKRCLERDRKARIPEIAAVRFLLQDALVDSSARPAGEADAARRLFVPRAAAFVVFGVAAALAGGLAASYFAASPAPPVARLSIPIPEGSLPVGGNRRQLDVSPDGAQVVYSSGSRLFLRPLPDADARPIQGSEGLGLVLEPVFSPDGRSIAFIAQGIGGPTLMRVSVTGGPASAICPLDGLYGLTWDESGLLFGQRDQGVMRVSPDGGKPERLVSVEKGEVAHGPQMLPDGRTVLFSIARGTEIDRWDKAKIVAHSLDSGKRTLVIDGGSDARYLPSGHLVYAVSGTLFAVAFDVERLTPIGNRVAVVEGVRRVGASGASPGVAQYGVAKNGMLAYIAGPVSAWVARQGLGIGDRSGKSQTFGMPPALYESPRVSPNGRRVAFTRLEGDQTDVWTFELGGTSQVQRLTFGGNNRDPIWSADGAHIAFQSTRTGVAAIFVQKADQPGLTAVQLTSPAQGESHSPESWSPRGSKFLFSARKDDEYSLWTYSLQDRKPVPFGIPHVRSRIPPNAVYSPDGRFVAYVKLDARASVYVEPDPPTGAVYQLPSQEAPHEPTWSLDTPELFYNPRPEGFEAIRITTDPVFTWGAVTQITESLRMTDPLNRRSYDVLKGGRFLGTPRPESLAKMNEASASRIEVVLNWFEDLKARVR